MDLFARNEGERYLCGLIDGPCQTTSLDEFVQDPAHGAIAQFFGVVRNHNEGLSAAAVDYDVHPDCERINPSYPPATGGNKLTSLPVTVT